MDKRRRASANAQNRIQAFSAWKTTLTRGQLSLPLDKRARPERVSISVLGVDTRWAQCLAWLHMFAMHDNDTQLTDE
jgi:hypothetical protein